MMFGEFNLIDKYFSNRQAQRKDVHLALGDDCAIVKVPENSRVAISTDTLVAGTIFWLRQSGLGRAQSLSVEHQ